MPSIQEQANQLKIEADSFVDPQTGVQQAKNSKFNPSLPWNKSSSKFWAPMSIDPARWDQLFPID
jgi:hypothetical protein